MLQPIRSRQTSGRLYAAVFSAVVLGVLLIFVHFENYARQRVLESARADSSNLASVLEAALNSSIRRLDADLIEIVRTAKSLNPGRVVELPRPYGTWPAYLEHFKVKFPEVSDFFVFDSQGQLLYSSDPTAKPFSIADRRHFQALRDDPAVGLFLSDVVITRTDHRATAIFGRALRDKDGNFAGIASVLLDFEHWQTAFNKLNIGPNGAIALRRLDNHNLILRRPARHDEYNKPVDSPLTRRISAGERTGVEQLLSPIDGILRTSSFHVLADYPIYINVAIAFDDALENWRRQALIAGLFVFFILAVIGLLLTQLWRVEIRRAKSLEDLVTSEHKVRELAYHDPLTNLPNRRLLLDRLNVALSQAKRFRRSLALMFLDIDHFKDINDTFGHDVGDELLKEISRRLVSCTRNVDTVSRQGGDEFIVVLGEITHPSDAESIASKIISEVAVHPCWIADQAFSVTISIGIAVYPIDGTDDTQELMKKADMAMYAAKAAGRNGYKFYEETKQPLLNAAL